MKISREEEPTGAIINMSSLLDVMFILLIFFMATTTFQQAEHDREVQLAKDSDKQKSASSDTKTMTINVRKNPGGEGTYIVHGLRMDLAQIRKEVRDNVARDANYKVIVRGDEWAFHGHVARAISECQNAGVKKVNIAYMTSTTAE